MVISMMFLIILLFIIGIILLKQSKKEEKIDNFSLYLLILAGLFIAIAFVAPYSITGKETAKEFLEMGQIGDTIGGIMNPFISIAAVIVTGLAFYMQYQANDLVRKQFEIQKFETQFYEMLRFHKENVNEMEVETANGKGVIKGRAVFYEMKKELEYLLKILDENSDELDENIFKEIYALFFWGKNIERNESNEIGFGKTNNLKWSNEFDKPDTKYDRLIKKIENSSSGKNFLKGHHSYLGHYYRHLFHIVKFVVNERETLVSEDKKIEYLRILRNQLSNYEQEMLFYNWLSGYGEKWEELEEKGNKLFTKYRVIHNLWYSGMYKEAFIEKKLDALKKRCEKLNKGKKLFEIDELKEQEKNP